MKDAKIKRFIEDMIAEHGEGVFRYMYNAKRFEPGKSTVFYSGPFWDEQEIEGIIHAVFFGKWLSSGENVFHFEREFSRRFGQAHALMVNSGSSANLVMVGALKKHFGWGDGDEVIVSVSGFPTTLSAIVQNGLVPVFVDVDLSDLNWDVRLLERLVTRKTRALFSSPVLGNPGDMDAVLEICRKRDLVLIADSCDSLGSTWRGKHLHQYAAASSFSFYPAHHITTGEGGMVTSDSEEIVRLARSFSWWGRDCYCIGAANLLADGTCGRRFDTWLPCYDGAVDHKYVYTQMGYNLKPLDIQGAIGKAQLEKFDDISRRRKRSKARMDEVFLGNIEGIRNVTSLGPADVCWFATPLVCATRELKERLVRHLESHRVQTRNYFSCNILLHPAYQSLGDAADFPNATALLDTAFFVGCSPHYDEDVFTYIDGVLRSFEPPRNRALL